MWMSSSHWALSDPTRLAIAQALLPRDLARGGIGELWQLSANLVAHHDGTLTAAGLVVRLHDARRSYLSLRHDDPHVVKLVGVRPAARRLRLHA